MEQTERAANTVTTDKQSNDRGHFQDRDTKGQVERTTSVVVVDRDKLKPQDTCSVVG